MNKTLLGLVLILATAAVLVFAQAARPYVGTAPTASDDIRSVAWDAQRRVTAMEHDYRVQKLVAFAALCCALWASICAYSAWGLVKGKRDETVLDMRLRLLEERQMPYLPPPTAYSLPQAGMPREVGVPWEPEYVAKTRHRHPPSRVPQGGVEDWEQEPPPPRASRHAGAPPPPRREARHAPVPPEPMEFPDEAPPSPPPPESRRPMATAPVGPSERDDTTPGGEGVVG